MIQLPPADPDLAHLARRNLIFPVGDDRAGERLDRFTAEAVGLSRGRLRELIDFGAVWVGGKVCRKQSRILQAGDWVTLQVPAYGPVRFYEIDPGRILFRDDWLLAYDKESGVPCQQTPYDGYNHLFGALNRYLDGKYLALHHRLDQQTSGVMLFALDPAVNPAVSALFNQRRVTKAYLAVVQGRPERDAWEEDRPIAKRKGSYYCPEDAPGKPARTEFRVLERRADRTLVEAHPLTGRTHQIRLHLAYGGLPIVGDSAYGGPPAPRLMLHAHALSFVHPKTGQALTIESPVPADFSAADPD